MVTVSADIKICCHEDWLLEDNYFTSEGTLGVYLLRFSLKVNLSKVQMLEKTLES